MANGGLMMQRLCHPWIGCFHLSRLVAATLLHVWLCTPGCAASALQLRRVCHLWWNLQSENQLLVHHVQGCIWHFEVVELQQAHVEMQ